MKDSPSSQEQFGPVAERYLTSDAHNRPTDISEALARVPVDGKVIVDVGTGAGHCSYLAAEAAELVIAIDLTEQMLKLVAQQAEARGLPNILPVLALAEAMPLPTRAVDGVICRVAAHHFRSVTDFVGEVARILKDGGWFLLIDTVSPDDERLDRELNELEKLRDPSHHRNWKPSEWRDLARSVGLAVTYDNLSKKEMDFDAWLERMRVPIATRAIIEPIVWSDDASLNSVLCPRRVGDRRFFSLPEYVLIAQKQN